MVGLAVVVVIEEDQVSYPQAAEADLMTAGHLHIGSVREPDAVICPVAVHCKTGTVKTRRRRAACDVFAADKTSDEASETAAGRFFL